MPDVSELGPLVPGAPVLVAGGGVTGKAVLAALSRFGVAATLCDDDPATLRGYAESEKPASVAALLCAPVVGSNARPAGPDRSRSG